MSTSSGYHDDNADFVDGYSEYLTHTNAKLSIMLHQLCDRCKRFIDDWELLKWAKDGIDVCNAQIKLRSPEYWVHFATIAQLLQSTGHCHLCAMVLSKLDYRNMAPDRAVRFMIYTFKEDEDKSGGFFPLFVEKYDDWLVAHLYLRFSNGSSHDPFDAAEQLQSVPIQPTDNLDQIKTWLAACLKKHKSCSTWSSNLEASSKRPTRLLELTPDGVRLRCDTSTIEGLQYLTLSHVWGDTPHRLRLTLSRLDEFQAAVPWSELPDIFIEALRVLRHTGYRYLWVDVLCIIQDSPSDWETEAASMDSVYSNAICSIAFLFPPGEGLMRTRKDPRTMSSCVIRKATQKQQGICIIPTANQELPDSRVPLTYIDGVPYASFVDGYVSRLNYHKWPITQRAWTFQEHLLCPRTVFYGHQTLMWECVEEVCDELAGSWLAKSETRDYNRASDQRKITQKRFISSRDVPHEIDVPVVAADYKNLLNYFANWKDLIREYSGRDLTVPSDRPIAFAGVARAFQAGQRLTYLAGIWAESLPDGLLWYVATSREEVGPISQSIREPGSDMAPSWSWLSCPLYKKHRIQFYTEYESFVRKTGEKPPNNLIFWAPLVHFQWHDQPLNQVPLKTFHDFSGLSLTLEVATYEECRLRSRDDAWYISCQSLRERLASSYHLNAMATLRCDDVRYHEKPPEKALLALLVETQDTLQTYCSFAGLALIPGREKGTWQRFGYWWSKLFLQDVRVQMVDSDDEQSSWESEHPTIKWKPGDGSTFLRLEGVKMEKLTLV